MTTPTYDKSHYSWVPPSSLASKSIIDNPENSTSNSPAPESRDRSYQPPKLPSYITDPAASSTTSSTSQTSVSNQDSGSEKPSLPRRSSSNYLTDAQEYKKLLERQKQEEREEEEQDKKEQQQDGEVGGGEQSSHGVSKQLSDRPMFARKKTFDYQDMKREMHEKLMADEAEGTTG